MLNSIAKEKILSYSKNAKLRDSQYKIFAKSQNLSVAKYAHLKIAKLTCRENFK